MEIFSPLKDISFKRLFKKTFPIWSTQERELIGLSITSDQKRYYATVSLFGQDISKCLFKQEMELSKKELE